MKEPKKLRDSPPTLITLLFQRLYYCRLKINDPFHPFDIYGRPPVPIYQLVFMLKIQFLKKKSNFFLAQIFEVEAVMEHSKVVESFSSLTKKLQVPISPFLKAWLLN